VDKQKYWQYVADEIVDTGKRQVINDGFMADFDTSGVDITTCKLRPLKNKNAPSNLRRILERCHNLESSWQFGRAIYEDEFNEYGGLYLYKFPSGVKVQKKFLEYFLRLYPGCQFFTNPSAKYYYCVAVRQDGKLVGGIAGVNRLCDFYEVKH